MMSEFDKSNIDYKKIILIFVGIILVIGLIIFLSVRLIGGKKDNNDTTVRKQTNTNGPTLNITSPEVSSLYTQISSCNSGNRYLKNDYFFTNKKVKVGEMSAIEKARCAFQFISEADLTFNNDELYLSVGRFDESYKALFGSSKIKKEDITNDQLRVYLNRENTESDYATVNYDSNLNVFRLRFDDQAPENPKMVPSYSALVSANSFDGGILLKEKIIYIKDVSKGKSYGYEVYSDPEHRNKIGGKKNLKKEDISINLSDYYNEAATITYVFRQDENKNYYFSSSKIDTE